MEARENAEMDVTGILHCRGGNPWKPIGPMA